MKQSSVTHLSRSAASLTRPLVSALWTVSALSPGFGLDPPPPPRTRTKGVKLLSEAWRGPALHLKGQQLHSAGPPFNHTQHYSDTGETSESSSGASAEINWWSRSPVRLQISWWSQWESAASCWPSAATTTNSSQLKQLRSQQITDFININIFIKNVRRRVRSETTGFITTQKKTL